MRMLQRLTVLLLAGLVLVSWLAPPATAQEAPAKKDHAMIYKQAVATLDKAEKKLAAGYTAEAKSLLKESNSLFKILQTELAPQLQQQQLTEAQLEQEKSTKKLAEDSLASGERLEKSAKDKEAQSAALEKKGQDQQSVKLQGEAKKEYELAQKHFLKAQILNMKNLQLVFGFLGRQ